ncbi:MAG: hypothetical protein ACT4O9_16205 [Blastocatellia bacterium]
MTDQRRTDSLTPELRMDMEHFDPTIVVELVIQHRVGHHLRVDDGDVTRGRFDLVVNELDTCWFGSRDVIQRDNRICIRDLGDSQFHDRVACHITRR